MFWRVRASGTCALFTMILMVLVPGCRICRAMLLVFGRGLRTLRGPQRVLLMS